MVGEAEQANEDTQELITFLAAPEMLDFVDFEDERSLTQIDETCCLDMVHTRGFGCGSRLLPLVNYGAV